MGSLNAYGDQITIEIVKGGFILTYPTVTQFEGQEVTTVAREVFVSPRKLNQKIKDVIESIGLVSEDK